MPLNCPVCGRAVHLRYRLAPALNRQWWVCPYSECRGVHRIEIRGAIVGAFAVFAPIDP